MGKYPWYAVVDDKEPLLQGDFINSCPVVIPPAIIKLENVSAEVIEYDVTIMSQSCDLEQKIMEMLYAADVLPYLKICSESQLPTLNPFGV